MRVLWLSHNLPFPPKGGVLQRNYNLIAQMGSRHRVHLLAFSQQAHRSAAEGRGDLAAAVEAMKRHCETVEILPLPTDRDPWAKMRLAARSLWTAKPYTVNWNRSPEMARLVRHAIESFDPELIHYDTIGLAEYHDPRLNVPHVLNHHNIESAMMRRRRDRERALPKRLYFLQEALKLARYEGERCPRFDLNVTVSAEDETTLAQAVPGLRTAVIPNGVDISYFSPGAHPSEEVPRSLVFAGGMGWYPNRDAMSYFAEVLWPRLKQADPAITMTVIGRRPPDSVLELARTDSSFRVTGYVDDVRPFLSKAAIYVCPIRDGGGSRLKILDAMAMGKPIVATTLAVEGTECVPEQHVLIGDTPEEFTANVLRLIRDDDLRRRVARAGRTLVEERYDWNLIGLRMDRLYSELVGSRSSRVASA